jgi:DNA gyrase subunit A
MADQPQDPIVGTRIPTNLADEMQQSYMAYAMSVIIGRALPDVRDGLKPANRRVLYTMNEMGLVPGRGYRKCAAIVGDVMGKYHPHGDAAVYDTLVRMAQDFNMRVLLVDGQGNFGSVDGDPPAAMRYTEARLTRVGAVTLDDIDRDTVDFVPNYDDRLQEPVVLPTPFPNLLVNGSAGIAVGMATNIPPHNLGEVVEALSFLLGNRDLTTDERLEGVMERITGPDFPTAGFIFGRAGIRQAQRTGRGSIVMRGRAEIETRKGDRESIVITEIPYQLNKTRLIERIAELVRDKKLDGIADIRDESDRRGMRIVLDVRKGEPSQVLLNNLYKHTQLQDTFGIIMLAIVNKRPRVLNLLEVCELFLDFRREVVRRRTAYDLRKAEARAHVLEGLVIALDHLDQVIALIRGSASPVEARGGLVSQFGLTVVQADAILEMQLQRLTGLERQKILDELAEKQALIAKLREILGSAALVDGIVLEELKKIREDHADPRRTVILDQVDEITVEDMIAEEDVAISITHSGYIKRTTIATYRAQKRGGRGRVGMRTRDEDFVDQLFIASTHSYVLIFTDRGRVYWLKVHELPEVGPQGRGKAVVNLVQLVSGEKIAAFATAKEFEPGRYVLLATRKGIVKKTDLSAFSNPRPSGIIALGVEDDDALIEAVLTSGKDKILLATKEGMAIQFSEEDVRPMGRAAYGVKGIELEGGDEVVALEVTSPGGTVLTVSENGYGKRTEIEEYRVQSRGGKGLINIKTSGRNGPVVGVKFLHGDEGVMLITEKGMIIRLNTADISTIGRNTQGVRLIQLEEGDHLVSVARLAEREEAEEPGGGGAPGPPVAS